VKTDTRGKPYASLAQTKAGDFLQADSDFYSDRADGTDFHCIRPGRICRVEYHEAGLYVTCAKGKHFLSGQLHEDDDSLIGFYSP
jgi:hypothetical protein